MNGVLYGFGSATVDFRIVTADLGTEYTAKLLARETYMLGGGAIANCLYQVGLLGTKTQWLGKLGDDAIGRNIVQELNKLGVGTNHIIIDETAISPFNVAVYAGEKKRRVGGVLLPNSLEHITPDEIDTWSALPKSRDWCLIEIGEIPLPVVLEFCRSVRKNGAKIVVDVDLDPLTQCKEGNPGLIGELFRLSDFLLPNYHAMQSMYPGVSEEEMTKRLFNDFGSPVIITAGEKGAFYTEDGNRTINVLPPVIQAVDTVGAGDAFHGGFLWALMNGESLYDAVNAATLCGAANCLAFGAREGMVDMNTFQDFQKRTRYEGT